VGQAANTARVNWSNDWYGAQGIGGSRILFTNGNIDPWHNLSVIPSISNNPGNQVQARHFCTRQFKTFQLHFNPPLCICLQAILIPSGSHCRQMQPSYPTDPADVQAARVLSAEILAQWLSE
jgi:hypothetical protein